MATSERSTDTRRGDCGSRAFAMSLTPLCLQSLGSAPCPSGSVKALAVLQAIPPAQVLHGRHISDANGREPRGALCRPGLPVEADRAGADSQEASRWDHADVCCGQETQGAVGMSRDTQPASGEEGAIATLRSEGWRAASKGQSGAGRGCRSACGCHMGGHEGVSLVDRVKEGPRERSITGPGEGQEWGGQKGLEETLTRRVGHRLEEQDRTSSQ